MTKKIGGAGGDNRDQNPKAAASEFADLRTVLTESQTATQSSIQQLGETLAGRLDALTTAITALVTQQNQRNSEAPLPAQQRHQPLPQQHPPPPGRHLQPQNLSHPPQGQHQHQQRNQQHNPYINNENEVHRPLFYEDLHQQRHHDNHWEKSFRVDIPEFHGGLRGDELLDWLVSVEEIMEFKQVLFERRVPLVAMRFRGHAATW